MTSRALGPREARVGDLPGEGVPERELLLSGDGRIRRLHDQAAAREVRQAVADGALRHPAQRDERAGPELRPDDGGVLHEPPRALGDPVQAGGDDGLHRLGHRFPERGVHLFAGHPDELERVQGVAAGSFQERLSNGRRDARLRKGIGQQLLGLLPRERRQPDRRRVDATGAPPRVPLEQLGARGAHHEHRATRHRVGHALDHVEEHLVRPVDVLQAEHDRPRGADGRDDPRPRVGHLDRGNRGHRPAHVTGCRSARDRLQHRQQPPAVLVVLLHAGSQRPQRLPDGFGVVRRAEAGDLPDDVGRGSERHRLAVRQAASGQPPRAALRGVADLVHEPRLAHARVAHHGDEVPRGGLHDPLEELSEQPQLVPSAHERRRLGGGRSRSIAQDAPDLQRLRLPFDPGRRKRLHLEEAAHCAQRRFADHHRTVRRQALHARRGVDHVAGDGLAHLRPFAETHHRLTRVDGDPHGQRRVGPSQLLHRREHAERGPHRPLGIVVVRDGRPEHAHDGIADELVERSAEPFDVGLGPRVEGQQCPPHVLRVGAIGSLGEPDQVDEQDGHDAALLARRGGAGGTGRAGRRDGGSAGRAELRRRGQRFAAGRAPERQRRTALQTEARVRRIVRAARRAGVHPSSL